MYTECCVVEFYKKPIIWDCIKLWFAGLPGNRNYEVFGHFPDSVVLKTVFFTGKAWTFFIVTNKISGLSQTQGRQSAENKPIFSLPKKTKISPQK